MPRQAVSSGRRAAHVRNSGSVSARVPPPGPEKAPGTVARISFSAAGSSALVFALVVATTIATPRSFTTPVAASMSTVPPHRASPRAHGAAMPASLPKALEISSSAPSSRSPSTPPPGGGDANMLNSSANQASGVPDTRDATNPPHSAADSAACRPVSTPLNTHSPRWRSAGGVRAPAKVAQSSRPAGEDAFRRAYRPAAAAASTVTARAGGGESPPAAAPAAAVAEVSAVVAGSGVAARARRQCSSAATSAGSSRKADATYDSQPVSGCLFQYPSSRAASAVVQPRHSSRVITSARRAPAWVHTSVTVRSISAVGRGRSYSTIEA